MSIKQILTVVVATVLIAGGIAFASTFPTALNSYSSGDIIKSAEWNAIESKIGVDGSAMASSIDYLIKHASSKLGSISRITTTDGVFIVADGSKFIGESGATARTSIGLGDVENTKLSTWAGSTSITTLGTVGTATGSISLWSNDVGYITAASETDPIWIASSTDWLSKAEWWATTTDALDEGSSNLYYTNARARVSISETVDGLTYTSGTGVFSITAGYEIPATSSIAEWDLAYGWGDHGIAGYLTGNESITLSGDVSGIGTTSITTTIGADKVHDTMIDWGTGASQVSLDDMPDKSYFIDQPLIVLLELWLM